MPRDFCQKPSWAKNAVATNRGWEDPNTGEVLVSLKGLLDIQKELGCAPTKKKATKKDAAKTAKKTTKPKASKKAEKLVVEKVVEETTEQPKGEEASFEDALVEVIKSLEVNEENYTEGGKPDANVLSDIMDVKVSADQRDVAWEKVQAERNADVSLSAETPVVDVDANVDL